MPVKCPMIDINTSPPSVSNRTKVTNELNHYFEVFMFTLAHGSDPQQKNSRHKQPHYIFLPI